MTHGMSDVSIPPFSEMRVLAVPDESSSRTGLVNDFAIKLHILCEMLKYMIFKYTFLGSNASPAVFRRTAMPLIAAYCVICVSRSFVGVGPIATNNMAIMVSLSACLCVWLLCLSLFFIKNHLVSIHVFSYM